MCSNHRHIKWICTVLLIYKTIVCLLTLLNRYCEVFARINNHIYDIILMRFLILTLDSKLLWLI